MKTELEGKIQISQANLQNPQTLVYFSHWHCKNWSSCDDAWQAAVSKPDFVLKLDETFPWFEGSTSCRSSKYVLGAW